MICPNCNTTNREAAHYCIRCRWWLAPACPFCQVVLPGGVFFCDQCGRQLGVTVETPVRQQHFAVELAEALQDDSSPILPPEPFQTSQTLTGHSQFDWRKTDGAARAEILRGITGEPTTQSILHRFVPAELLDMLQTARARREVLGERRVVTIA